MGVTAARLSTPYNDFVLKRLIILFLLSTAFGQTAPISGQTVLAVPFENQSKAPGLEWISEGFPELLQERLTSPTLYVLPREDRTRAYDRLGVPGNVRLSRATLYRIAEQLDVDYVVLGSYTFDGRTFSATARVLNMRRERLLPSSNETGPLTELLDIQTKLAWDILRIVRPDLSTSKQVFVSSAPAIRLDAFENYVRGIIAPNAQEQIRRYREAVRLNPTYTEALLQLGKALYRDHQYGEAIAFLARVPQGTSEAREANFYLGLAAYYAGDFARAETAFTFVASRMPLSEVYNNLGVVASRRGKSSSEAFQKAVDADPENADYHFNLGLSLYRAGDLNGAPRQVREALALRPADGEAKSFLDTISSATSKGTTVPHAKPPLERIRLNYDENSFRQVAMKIEAAAELRLAKTDAHTHAQYHVDRGNEFLKQGFISEADREFREAVSLDNANATAHSGMARVLEANNDGVGARSEAQAALSLRQFVEPLLVLARLSLRDNEVEAASEDLERALRLEPQNAQAQSLKQSIAAKLAEKAQPLPNQ
jgi:Flp pilus assembly protein TadD/TolB-like protein